MNVQPLTDGRSDGQTKVRRVLHNTPPLFVAGHKYEKEIYREKILIHSSRPQKP